MSDVEHLSFAMLKKFAWAQHWSDTELCRQLGIDPNTLRNYAGRGKAGRAVHIPRYIALAVLALSNGLGVLK